MGKTIIFKQETNKEIGKNRQVQKNHIQIDLTTSLASKENELSFRLFISH